MTHTNYGKDKIYKILSTHFHIRTFGRNMSIPSSSPIVNAFLRGAEQQPIPTNPPIDINTQERAAEELSMTHPRRLQQVCTKAARTQVVKWMIAREQEGVLCLPSKTVKEFPAFFRGTEKANLQKASRWWKKRHELVKNGRKNDPNDPLTVNLDPSSNWH